MKETIYDNPTSTLFNWTFKICKEWLRGHKLDDQGRVNELRETLSEYKSDSKKQILLDLKASLRIDRNTDAIYIFIGSILSMISIIMRVRLIPKHQLQWKEKSSYSDQT